MDNYLETLEPIKQEIIARLYGIDEINPDAIGRSNSRKALRRSTKQHSDLAKTTTAESEPQSDENGQLQSAETKSYEIPPPPSYEKLADELSLHGDPEGILRHASSHRKNSLVLTESDVVRLEQEALRELARGRRKKR